MSLFTSWYTQYLVKKKKKKKKKNQKKKKKRKILNIDAFFLPDNLHKP